MNAKEDASDLENEVPVVVVMNGIMRQRLMVQRFGHLSMDDRVVMARWSSKVVVGG